MRELNQWRTAARMIAVLWAMTATVWAVQEVRFGAERTALEQRLRCYVRGSQPAERGP